MDARNIKFDFKKYDIKVWTELFCSGHGPMASFCERDNGSSGSVICKEGLEHLRHYYLTF
jgi:hypothetical protein